MKNNLFPGEPENVSDDDNKVESFTNKPKLCLSNKNSIKEEESSSECKNNFTNRKVNQEFSNVQEVESKCELDCNIQSSNDSEDEKQIRCSDCQIPNEKSLKNDDSYEPKSQLSECKDTLQDTPKNSKTDLESLQRSSIILCHTEQSIEVNAEVKIQHVAKTDCYMQADEESKVHQPMQTACFVKVPQKIEKDEDVKVEQESQIFQSECADQESKTPRVAIEHLEYQFKANKNFNMSNNRKNNLLNCEEEATTKHMLNQSFNYSEKFLYDHDYEFGIRNEGNTCFLNAALQLVFSATEFIEYYHQKKYLPTDQDEENKVQMKSEGYQFCNAMHEICQDIFDQNKKVIRVSKLRNLLKNNFLLYEQSDSMQVILDIFDNLQSEETPENTKYIPTDYKDCKEAWEGYISMNSTITDQLFSGMQQKVIRCYGCGNTKYVFENFYYVWLDMNADNLKDAYINYINDKAVYEEGILKCNACGESPYSETSKEMVKLPKYCMFLLNRFNMENEWKDEKKIKYPENLQLSDKYESNMNYELRSIVVHSGGLHGGHYVTVAKKNDKWKEFNDSSSRRIKQNQALKKQAYILIYKKV